MKRFWGGALMLLSIAGGVATSANMPSITVDENGGGIFAFPDSGMPLPGVVRSDPGPGGLDRALTYALLSPPALIIGDLIITELTLQGSIVSDIIRFNPANGATGYPASLVFYSNDADGNRSLADTGFPALLYANRATMAEVSGSNAPVVYTPTASQPGFVSGFDVTYHVLSDSPIPEPATIFLVSIACILVFLGRWRPNRHRLGFKRP